MEMHQLRYVVFVAEEGSFTAAAERARVSQSALSTQVAKLERELGQVLFERGRHGATPTAAGDELLSRAVDVLDAVRAMSDTASTMAGAVMGSVHLGAVIGCDLPWLSEALASLAAQHPNVRIHYGENGSEQLVHDLLARRLDVAVVGHAADLPAPLVTRTIVRSPLVVVLPPERMADRIRIADLREENLVTLPPGTGVRAALDIAAGLAGVCLRPAYEVNSGGMIVDLIRHGAGVGVLSAAMTNHTELPVAELIDGGESRLSIAHRPNPTRATNALLKSCWTSLGTHHGHT